ncbi:hypothetical protein C8J57DRAFT_1246424 [Mycena rebaudengoi]|nr:hypothetical protein C8J57DRAFT_1246424 [Mycena rebaudengoi]
MVSSMKHLGNSTVGNLPLASMPPKTARVARTKRDGTDKENDIGLNNLRKVARRTADASIHENLRFGSIKLTRVEVVARTKVIKAELGLKERALVCPRFAGHYDYLIGPFDEAHFQLQGFLPNVWGTCNSEVPLKPTETSTSLIVGFNLDGEALPHPVAGSSWKCPQCMSRACPNAAAAGLGCPFISRVAGYQYPKAHRRALEPCGFAVPNTVLGRYGYEHLERECKTSNSEGTGCRLFGLGLKHLQTRPAQVIGIATDARPELDCNK